MIFKLPGIFNDVLQVCLALWTIAPFNNLVMKLQSCID